MAENKTKKTAASVEEFLNAIPDEQKKADSIKLNKMFEKITGQPAKMWGSSIIGYGSYSYTRKDKKSFDFMATGFSPRKKNLTLYIMPGYDNLGDKLDKLGKHSIGKSCLYINKLADIDTKVLESLIKEGYEEIVGKHVDYNTGEKK